MWKALINKIFKKGVDICFESAGSTETIEFGMEIINKKGVIHFASHPDEKKFISIKPHDLIEGKKISGSWGGNSKPDRDISRFYSILKTNKLRLKELYSKIYNLNEINLAVSEFKKNSVFRPIIKMDHTS